MNIKYQFHENGWLATVCPHGMNITGIQVCGVGSTSCVEDCPHFIGHDKEKQTIECSRKDNFFVEIEVTCSLAGTIKRIETFPTQSSRNLFMKIIDRWESVKISRFGQGAWNA